MCIIKFNNFSFRYKGNDEYAIENINLKVQKGKFIILAGETGVGKTSLIRCMNGLIPQFYAGYYKGSVEVAGKDTTEVAIADLSTEVGVVFQNPENQLIAMNVEHEIAFGLENLGVPREEIKYRIEEVVKLTEIEKILDKAPFEISGGEQQRVALASILVLEPKVLVLDEPTANLDPFFAQKILTLLKKIQVERNITIIISEHRMDLVIPLSDEIILMRNGTILEHNFTEKIINSQNFYDLDVNKPVIYSIFKYLIQENLYFDKIPVSIEEAVKIFKEIT